MSPRLPVRVIQQVDHAPPGRIARVLTQLGIPWTLHRPATGEPLPVLVDSGALIVLGGPMSANDELPFLLAELRLLEDAVARNIPVLGICLGGQLLAKALGATVRKCAAPEIGYLPIWPTAEAGSDPVLNNIGPGEIVCQWHNETFDVPRGAKLLATSPACENQAFRYGSAWGVQFHPEADTAIFHQWLTMDADCGAGREAGPNAAANAGRVSEDRAMEVMERMLERLIEGI